MNLLSAFKQAKAFESAAAFKVSWESAADN